MFEQNFKDNWIVNKRMLFQSFLACLCQINYRHRRSIEARMSSTRQWRRIHRKQTELPLLLDHKRKNHTRVTDDETLIRALENQSVTLDLCANLREKHSRQCRNYPSVVIA